jgi:hypothetical protein
MAERNLAKSLFLFDVELEIGIRSALQSAAPQQSDFKAELRAVRSVVAALFPESRRSELRALMELQLELVRDALELPQQELESFYDSLYYYLSEPDARALEGSLAAQLCSSPELSVGKQLSKAKLALLPFLIIAALLVVLQAMTFLREDECILNRARLQPVSSAPLLNRLSVGSVLDTAHYLSTVFSEEPEAQPQRIITYIESYYAEESACTSSAQLTELIVDAVRRLPRLASDLMFELSRYLQAIFTLYNGFQLVRRLAYAQEQREDGLRAKKQDALPSTTKAAIGCAVCRSSAELACAACGTASYCSAACQSADWSKHQKYCA